MTLDNPLRDVRYAWRTLRRTPVAAATIVATVGLGLGLVAAVYTVLNAVVFRVDEVRNPYELYAVERQRSAVAEPATFTRADYEALLRETSIFADAFASTSDVQAYIEGVRREGRLVTEHLVEEELLRLGQRLVDLEGLHAGLALGLRQELAQDAADFLHLPRVDLPECRDDETIVNRMKIGHLPLLG